MSNKIGQNYLPPKYKGKSPEENQSRADDFLLA